MLAWAFALVRVWTSLYTIGMPAPLADARRAEIESDLWEFEHALDRDDSQLPPFVHVLVRLLLGVPDDLLWRAELMDLRSRRRRTGVWIAAATAIIVTGLWLRESRQPLELPDLPRSPSWPMKPMPPPPPPPPRPPGYQRGAQENDMPSRAMPPPAAPKNPRRG